MKRTREDIIWEIENHTKTSQSQNKLAEFYTNGTDCNMKLAEDWGKLADYHNNRANKAKQELKDYDEANK